MNTTRPYVGRAFSGISIELRNQANETMGLNEKSICAYFLLQRRAPVDGAVHSSTALTCGCNICFQYNVALLENSGRKEEIIGFLTSVDPSIRMIERMQEVNDNDVTMSFVRAVGRNSMQFAADRAIMSTDGTMGAPDILRVSTRSALKGGANELCREAGVQIGKQIDKIPDAYMKWVVVPALMAGLGYLWFRM